MSLITCCPACGTMFRVVPDQLKISEGWVRCGHCTEVFDASAYMVQDAPASRFEPAPQQPLESAPRDPGAAVPLPGPSDEPSPVAIARAHAPQPGTPDSQLEESPLDQPFVFRRSDLGDDDEAPSVSPPLAPSGALAAAEREEDIDPGEEGLEQLSFMRKARRQAFWRSRSMRAWLSAAALLLSGVLLVQVALHEHDRLAASEPALRPWIERMCNVLGCAIEPPRQIESVAIESSSFNRLNGDAYRLNFTLRNNAAFALEAPAMELTLTDSQDQPLLRRILRPAELGGRDTLAAGADWSVSVPLALADSHAGRVAGYRLLAFYP
jgi:predicted Zn finger-like uncharacterized protein